MMTMKVHSLLHLTTCTLDFGPLCQFSAYRPEHMNGLLTRQIHGTKNFVNQVLNRFTTFTLFHNILEVSRDALNRRITPDTILGSVFIRCGVLKKETQATKLWIQAPPPYSNVLFKKNNVKKLTNVRFNNQVKQQLQNICREKGNDFLSLRVYMFEKIKIAGRSFYTQQYDSLRKSSCYLLYASSEKLYIGRLFCFLYIADVKKMLAVITRFTTYKPGVNKYKIAATAEETHDVIDVMQIKDQMIRYNDFVSEYFGDCYHVEDCAAINCCEEYRDLTNEERELKEWIDYEYSRYVTE